MTERDKIIETLNQTSDIWKEEERHGYIVSVDLEKIADALIAAGIGDVKETEHRAEVAERALRSLAQLCAKGAKYYLQSDKAVKERERELYDEWIKQAKKELTEE